MFHNPGTTLEKSDLDGGIHSGIQMYCQRNGRSVDNRTLYTFEDETNARQKGKQIVDDSIQCEGTTRDYKERDGETASSLPNVKAAAACASSMIFFNDSGSSNPFEF